MMETYLPIVVKLLTAFAGLWISARILGKREIAQLSPFDFISSMVLSELVGNTIYDEHANIGMLLFALAVWVSLSYLFEKLMNHNKPLRKKLEGQPELLIMDGKIDMDALERNHIDFDELRAMLRQKDVFSVSEVAYAVYETNGSLSLLKHPKEEALKRSDLKLASGEQARLPAAVIEKGKVQTEVLDKLGYDENWLRERLHAAGITDTAAIMYAECTEEGTLKLISSKK